MVQAGDIIRASDIAVQACRVKRTAVQSITDSSATAVAFDDEQFDTDGMHSTSVSNTRITINTAGIYVVGFTGTFVAGADYVRTYAELRIAGSIGIARQQTSGTSTSVPQAINVSTVWQFAAGDYVEVLVFQDNTANAARNLELVASRSPEFYAARIGS